MGCHAYSLKTTKDVLSQESLGTFCVTHFFSLPSPISTLVASCSLLAHVNFPSLWKILCIKNIIFFIPQLFLSLRLYDKWSLYVWENMWQDVREYIYFIHSITLILYYLFSTFIKKTNRQGLLVIAELLWTSLRIKV